MHAGGARARGAHRAARVRSVRAARAAARSLRRPGGGALSRAPRGGTRAAAVRVPGSSANLGAGFDCIGLAVDRYLDASFEPAPGALTVLRPEGAPSGDDLVAISFRRALAARGLLAEGVLKVSSGIPIGCGLGSSAAALVAGTALALAAAGDELDASAAFGPATLEEGHGDNTGASAFGGLIAVVGDADAPRVLQLELSNALGFAFAAPPTRLSTRAARAALPATVPHGVAVGSLARMAALLRGLATADEYLLRQGFQDDLHVPYRLPLIAGADGALAAALEAGAWAGTVSGAGSGLLAVCAPADAERVARAMAAGFAERHGAEGVVSFSLHPEPRGVRALSV
ncbi:MAG: homoserine kinase [Gemmatimonadetes bacterium]|nr:homoserine kinase [Gemmatimonadota bacterium]